MEVELGIIVSPSLCVLSVLCKMGSLMVSCGPHRSCTCTTKMAKVLKNQLKSKETILEKINMLEIS